MRTNDDLIDDVERRAAGYLGERNRTAAVLGAMRKVDRRLFLPSTPLVEVYEDRALPIGGGQTCSEPSMVAFMLDLLEIESGQRILEVGSGSGYAAAVAALLCGSGVVYACETLPGLAESMRKHLDAWREDRRARDDCSPAAEIRIIVRDGSAGFPEAAPFDRILVSAGVQPGRIGVGFREETLLAQLNVGGILIYPETLGSLHRTRKSGSSLIRDEWEGVAFVPLRGRNA